MIWKNVNTITNMREGHACLLAWTALDNIKVGYPRDANGRSWVDSKGNRLLQPFFYIHYQSYLRRIQQASRLYQ